MDLGSSDNEMPIPSYAEGTRILVIDLEMASLTHTTSLLEEATYKVTCIECPNVALSLIQERAHEYDLVIAAMDMGGMNGLTFLRTVKTLSDIPVAMTSYYKDDQLAIVLMREGACSFFLKPMRREDARGLWQFVYSKGKKRTDSVDRNKGNDLHHSDSESLVVSSKGKGKESAFPTIGSSTADEARGRRENEQNNQKRKGIDHGKEEAEYNITKCIPKRMYKKSEKLELNVELHAKFMKALLNGLEDVPSTSQHKFGTTDLALLYQNTSSGANLMLQAPNVSSSVAGLAAARQNYLSSQNHRPETRTTTNGGLSVPNFRTLSGAQNGEQASWSPSFNPRSQLPGTPTLSFGNNVNQIGIIGGASSMNNSSLLSNSSNQLVVNETADNQSTLGERIDQIRREYQANNNSGQTSFIPNNQAVTVEHLLPYILRNFSQPENVSNGDVRSTAELVNGKTNVLGGNVVQTYDCNGLPMNPGYSNPQNVCPPHLRAQFLCAPSQNYVQSSEQIPSNLQVETTGVYQTPNFPSSENYSNNLLPTYGLANQAVHPTDDLSGRNLEDVGVMYSNEEIRNNVEASYPQQPTDDDMSFNTMVAELLMTEYGNSDLASLGFN